MKGTLQAHTRRVCHKCSIRGACGFVLAGYTATRITDSVEQLLGEKW